MIGEGGSIVGIPVQGGASSSSSSGATSPASPSGSSSSSTASSSSGATYSSSPSSPSSSSSQPMSIVGISNNSVSLIVRKYGIRSRSKAVCAWLEAADPEALTIFEDASQERAYYLQWPRKESLSRAQQKRAKKYADVLRQLVKTRAVYWVGIQPHWAAAIRSSLAQYDVDARIVVLHRPLKEHLASLERGEDSFNPFDPDTRYDKRECYPLPCRDRKLSNGARRELYCKLHSDAVDSLGSIPTLEAAACFQKDSQQVELKKLGIDLRTPVELANVEDVTTLKGWRMQWRSVVDLAKVFCFVVDELVLSVGDGI